MANAARSRGVQHRNDVRVNRRLTTGKLYDFGVAFGGDEMIEDLFHFVERQIETRTRVGETEGTIHVAGAVDLDNAEARVLLMVGTQAAIVGAAALDGGRVLQRDRSRLVEFGQRRVRLRVAVDKRFKQPVL